MNLSFAFREHISFFWRRGCPKCKRNILFVEGIVGLGMQKLQKKLPWKPRRPLHSRSVPWTPLAIPLASTPPKPRLQLTVGWKYVQLAAQILSAVADADIDVYNSASVHLGASVRGERANFTRLVLGCIEENFASKYSFENYRRDPHNALLCTVLYSQFFV